MNEGNSNSVLVMRVEMKKKVTREKLYRREVMLVVFVQGKASASASASASGEVVELEVP